MSTKIPEIKVTTNYSQFKRLCGNRDLSSYDKIIKSIKRVGYWINPIMVNEKFEVIDGQNRLKAAEELGLPIYYYVQSKADVETARALNLGRSNWQPIDYIKSFAEEGNPSYQMFLKLIKDNDGFSVNEVAALLDKTIKMCHGAPKKIVLGELQMSVEDYNRIDAELKEISKCRTAISHMIGTHSTIIGGIAWCLRLPECNNERLIYAINSYYPLLNPVVRAEDFLRDLSNIYNRSLKKQQCLHFDLIFRNRQIEVNK